MVKFLIKELAYKQLLDETKFKYYSLIEPQFFQIRYGYSSNTGIKTILKESLRDFTKDEMNMIENISKVVDSKLTGCPKIETYYAKVTSNFEFGFPHTVQNVIILPENFITSYKNGYISKKDFTKTLLHEKFHILQRYFPSTFTKLYNQKYNFTYYDTSNILKKAVLENYIINPDGYDLSWVYPIDYGRMYILPYCSYDNVTKSIKTRIIVFEQNNTILYSGDLNKNSAISGVREFYNKFINICMSCYHVNEIAAYDLAEFNIEGNYLVD